MSLGCIRTSQGRDSNVKEELIAAVTQRTGLGRAQAEEAIEAVFGFLRENPAEIGSLVGVETGSRSGTAGRERLNEAREKIAPVAERGKEVVGEARERLAPVAEKGKEAIGEVGEKVGTRLRTLLKRNDGKDESHEGGGQASQADVPVGGEVAATNTGPGAEPEPVEPQEPRPAQE
jgi:hypothetical protein